MKIPVEFTLAKNWLKFELKNRIVVFFCRISGNLKIGLVSRGLKSGSVKIGPNKQKRKSWTCEQKLEKRKRENWIR